MHNTRKAAVAGAFYTNNPNQLNQELDTMLSGAVVEYEDLSPKALIVPHAGYIYSGEIAASAYVYLKKIAHKIKRVVIFGPAHRVGFKGLALPSVDYLETPLGNLPVDKDEIANLLTFDEVITFDDADKQEHSVEVQLPFIQKVLDNDVKIIPFTVGMAKDVSISKIIEHFWKQDDTITIISTDLSHFLNYEDAKKLDSLTTNNIETLNYEQLQGQNACGFIGVRGLLNFCRKNNIEPIRLDIRNSGDTQSDKSRVVGYGSWLVSERSKSSYLAEKFGNLLIENVRNSINYSLSTGSQLGIDVQSYPLILQQNGACFVTLEKNGILRGCIGSIIATRPLIEDVVSHAYNSAFGDPRFPKLKSEELENLSICISILTVPLGMSFSSEADLLSQLRPNIDGLIIADKGKQAVYLPSVWEHFSFSTEEDKTQILYAKKEFLNSLKVKGGLPANHWSDTFRAYRFQSIMIKDSFISSHQEM